MIKYRVGFIGCGLMAMHHASAYYLNPKTEIVAASDIDNDNLELFCKRFDIPNRYLNYQDMLENETLDIIAPILPVKNNPKAVIDSAQTQVKGIYCEKPIASNLINADQMVDECAKHGIIFACGDAMRNYPQLLRTLEFIKEGGLGEIKSINAYDPTNEISGGGCQTLSVVQMFAFDSKIEAIIGWMNDAQSDNDQSMGGYIKFTNGIECFLNNKESVKKGIEVIGTEGVFYHSGWETFSISKKDSDGNLREMNYNLPTVAKSNQQLTNRIGNLYNPGFRTTESINSFVSSIDTGEPLRCPGFVMRNSLEIAIALRESARQNNSPVSMPLINRDQNLYPVIGRLENKKESLSAGEYDKRINEQLEYFSY